MSDDHDGRLRQYEGQLRREEIGWRARFDLIIHSDRAAVDLGINTVKTAVLMNAGALVALIAFASQQSDKNPKLVSSMFRATPSFVWGLVSATATFAIAYIYQSALTRVAQRMLEEVSTIPTGNSLRPLKWLPWLTWITRTGMVVLAFISFGCFVRGALAVASVFHAF